MSVKVTHCGACRSTGLRHIDKCEACDGTGHIVVVKAEKKAPAKTTKKTK